MIDQRSIPTPRHALESRPTDRGLTRRQVWAAPRHHRAWRRRTIGVLLAIFGVLLFTWPTPQTQAAGTALGVGGAYVTVRAHRVVAAGQALPRG